VASGEVEAVGVVKNLRDREEFGDEFGDSLGIEGDVGHAGTLFERVSDTEEEAVRVVEAPFLQLPVARREGLETHEEMGGDVGVDVVCSIHEEAVKVISR
jgi:hypothetical protein